jgi:PleD family two-component response regulator
MTDEVYTVEQLIDYADQALLHAKKTGRNRVVLWPIQ